MTPHEMSWKVVNDKKGEPRIGENSGLELSNAKLRRKLAEAVNDKRLATIFRAGSQKTLSFPESIHIDCQTATELIEVYAVQQGRLMYASIQLKPDDEISLDQFRAGLLLSLRDRAVLVWSE